jgi:hypothetical protein
MNVNKVKPESLMRRDSYEIDVTIMYELPYSKASCII